VTNRSKQIVNDYYRDNHNATERQDRFRSMSFIGKGISRDLFSGPSHAPSTPNNIEHHMSLLKN